jgi:succinate dehydrogenase / fumarate reductase flavoprotein subunit
VREILTEARRMEYPENIKQSIELVNKTREKRLTQIINRLHIDEAEKVLNDYHPDFRPEATRKINIGPNKGEEMINEVVDLLEAFPLIEPSQVDLSDIEYDVDVLIIGGGGAGCVASLWASYSGISSDNILIAQKLRLGDSNSIMATGAIQIAVAPNDSPARHFLDTMGGGLFANKPELVKALVHDAPFIMKWREELGVVGTKTAEGEFILTKTGGCSRDRVTTPQEYTGKEMMRILSDEVQNTGINISEFTPAIELLKDEKAHVTGAVLLDMETGEYKVVRAKSTIITTGGFGRLHMQGFPTTNHYGATADGIIIAYRAGAKLRDMDSCQYHPSGSIYPSQIYGRLATEKFRSVGAQPVNKHGELFVHPLEPRNIESSMFIKEIVENQNGVKTPSGLQGIWIDIPILELIHGEGYISKHFGAEYRTFKKYDIDISKEPILVYPTIHFQNGGIDINKNTETSIPGLFAAGEVTGGVHGKNRLGGNALTEYLVFGRRAGISAAKYSKKNESTSLSLDHVVKYIRSIKEITKGRKAPILLPEYRNNKVLSKKIFF